MKHSDNPQSPMSKSKKNPQEPAGHIAGRIAKRVRMTTSASKRRQLGREANAAYAMLQRHCNQLAEHFSSVQILATKVEASGSTSDFAAGSGDLHARVHMAWVWVDRVEGFYRE